MLQYGEVGEIVKVGENEDSWYEFKVVLFKTRN